MNTWRTFRQGYQSLRRHVPGHMVFGATIAAANIYHIREKPETDMISRARYVTVSLVKGTVYSAFYPVAMFGLLYSACTNSDDFRSHLVPCSKYGNQIEQASQEIRRRFPGTQNGLEQTASEEVDVKVSSSADDAGCPFILPTKGDSHDNSSDS